MKILKLFLFTILLASASTSMLSAANIWQDDFDDNKLDPAYETPNGGGGAGPPEWVEEEGVAKQIQPKPGDPTYLAIELDQDINFCGQLVRIRFDEWVDHDRSRAGVGFWLDPAGSYQGYTTVIHNSLTAGNYQFLNDARAWDGAHIENFDTGGVGSWFWMRAEINEADKSLVGKVWVGDLADEPDDWMIETDYSTYGGLRSPTRWVGLNGGAGTGDGFNVVSFD
ncbi:hypothetical protein GF312_15100, partial [Candidatus Poribacteria bacterium]|nr:hypothetical protein [Candidatus Poribacteria bacterium]